jgi:hypothetical protein
MLQACVTGWPYNQSNGNTEIRTSQARGRGWTVVAPLCTCVQGSEQVCPSISSLSVCPVCVRACVPLPASGLSVLFFSLAATERTGRTEDGRSA